MSGKLHLQSLTTPIYRIYDPIENKFCCSGRGLYAKNGRSVWASRSAAMVALINMPKEVRERATIKVDVQGIWFGDVQEWLWFHDELFCSIECMFKFIDKWHKEQEHGDA